MERMNGDSNPMDTVMPSSYGDAMTPGAGDQGGMRRPARKTGAAKSRTKARSKKARRPKAKAARRRSKSSRGKKRTKKARASGRKRAKARRR